MEQATKSYTIQRRIQTTAGYEEAYYVVIDDETRRVVDEFETIDAAREIIKWLP